METNRAVILFATIQGSTTFGYVTQSLERYNEMLREFHALVRRVVDEYAQRNGLDDTRLMKSVKGDECCLFLIGGEKGKDEIHAMNLAVELKERWKASDFSKFTRAGDDTTLYPAVDLRVGIGAGDIAMQYDDWAGRVTPEGLAISEAKGIERAVDENTSLTLIAVNWDAQSACLASNAPITFGDPYKLTGKGIPESTNVPVYPVKEYKPWQGIQAEVVPDPKTEWELFDRALALQNSGELQAVIDAYQRALEVKPDFHEAWYNLGIIYQHKGEYDPAIHAFLKALEIRPDDYGVWNNLGVAYHHKEEYDLAIESYQTALEIKPDYHEAWFNLGIAHRNKWQYDQAIQAYQTALGIKPDYYEAWYNLGVAHRHKGDFGLAIDAYQKALQIKPDSDEAWYMIGVAYDDQEEYDEAIGAFQTALALRPDNDGVWNNLGVAYQHKEEYDEAIRAFKKALEINPDKVGAWYNLACAYSLKGDSANAVQHLSTSITSEASWRERAKTDSDFIPIRNDPTFRKLVYGEEP